MRSSIDGHGLALLRMESLEAAIRSGSALRAGEAVLFPGKPAWLVSEDAPAG
jgi:hypothetical protein